MNITYNVNPLNTTIELDEMETEIFRLKIKINELQDIAFDGYYYSRPGHVDLGTLRKYVDPKYFLNEDVDGGKSKLDQRVDDLLAYYIDDLKDSHCGDCTCIPCSCGKCMAEQLLGIDTIPRLGKHEASKINSAFNKSDGTIEGALEHLRTYNPGPYVDKGNPHWSKEKHDYWAPQWIAQAERAHRWLLEYRERHFPLYNYVVR